MIRFIILKLEDLQLEIKFCPNMSTNQIWHLNFSLSLVFPRRWWLLCMPGVIRACEAHDSQLMQQNLLM